MKKCFVKLTNRLLHSTIHQVMRYFQVFIANPFSLLWSFFSQENCVSFGLLVSCLSLSQSAQIPLVNLLQGFSLIFLNFLIFIYCCKRILIWQKILRGLSENLFEYYFLNIIVNVNFFSDLKFEYHCQYYAEILLRENYK